jgi:hypothetical protein
LPKKPLLLLMLGEIFFPTLLTVFFTSISVLSDREGLEVMEGALESGECWVGLDITVARRRCRAGGEKERGRSC